MGMISEFKEFAMRGNVMDMAVGIVIGAAFGGIVKSFVADVIMPPIGILTGGVDFSDIVLPLQDAVINPETKEVVTAAVAINLGTFINTVINFLIIAFAIFMVIKVMNNLKKKEEEKPAEPKAPPKEEVLLEEIRDILKAKG